MTPVRPAGASGQRAAARAAALAAVLLCAVPARAQSAADQPPVNPAAQKLYEDALQSIAEGRQNDASATLSQVVEQEPLHAGAWLDLALIQCGLGHADEAERLFATIETRFDPPPGIVELIADARNEGCHLHQAHHQTSLTVARGIDQNVNQGSTNTISGLNDLGQPVDLAPLPDFQPRHDQYTLVSVDYLRDLSSNGMIGFVQFQDRRNDTLHQYNTASLFAGVESPWRFGNWAVRATGMVGFVTLGGQYYQRQEQLQARVTPPLPLPDSLQFNVTASATHIDYMTLDNFDSNTMETRGQLSHSDDDNYLSLNLGYLDDHATGARPGGNRHGTLSTALWRRQLGGDVTGELGYTRQTWYSSSEYLPGLLNQIRGQQTQVWRAAVRYPLSKYQSVELEVRQVRNKENISVFQYNDRQLQLSWQWQGL